MSYRYYRNSEGYSDPTAGAAINNVVRQQRVARMSERNNSREHQRANRRLKHLREAEQHRIAMTVDKEVAE